MPNVADLIDEFRSANPGLDIKVLWARDEQTGVEAGRRPEQPKQAWDIPADFRPFKGIEKKGKKT